MYSGDEYYGDEVTSPIKRPSYNPRRISYRGVSALWSTVHTAFVFRYDNNTFHASTEAAFRRDVDSLIMREMRGTDYHVFGEC